MSKLLQNRFKKATIGNTAYNKARQGSEFVKSSLSYFHEIDLIKRKAINALKKYHEERINGRYTEREVCSSSLSECHLFLRQILEKFIAEGEFETSIFFYQLLGELAVLSKNYCEAIKYFTQMSYIASTYEKTTDQAMAYEKIGKCHLRMTHYQKALMMFKMQLKIGWLHLKERIELNAYDNIGLANYYLGNMEAASYYHNRMVNNLIEPMDSPYRRYVIYSEKKMMQKLELQSKGLASYKDLISGPRPIATKDPMLRKASLFQEVKLCTEGDETPRVLSGDPWQGMKISDLPSPMHRSVYKEGNQFDKIRKPDSLSQSQISNYRMINASINRCCTARSSEHRTLAPRSFFKPVQDPEIKQTSSGVFVSHLSKTRNKKFEESEFYNRFSSTFNLINEIPNKLFITYSGTNNRRRPNIKTMNRNQGFSPKC